MIEMDQHDRGLSHDVLVLEARRAQRRQSLQCLGALCVFAGAGGVVALGRDNSTVLAEAAAKAAGVACPVTPEETEGPFPADGSSRRHGGPTPNVLARSCIVRSDIRSSFGGASGIAPSVPLTIRLKLVAAKGCADLSGHAIYVWHCDRDGNYSMYAPQVAQENYLRGVQATDEDGQVEFTSVFPACYDGRMPHVDFEVYRNVASASSSGHRLKTSQMALPIATCVEVYASAGRYAESVGNLSRTDFASDMVFSDGVEHQMATMGGNVKSGYRVALTMAIVV